MAIFKSRPAGIFIIILIIVQLHFSTNLRSQAIFDTTYHWVDSVYESLSLRQRIAQLIMVDAYSNRNENHIRQIEHLIKEYNIGGIVFFQGSPIRQAKQTNRYQSLAQTPIMIAMDAEWGLAMRLDSVEPFPRQMMLGAMENTGIIYDMGLAIGNQCRRLGVHVNFAPVVDINNNPNNPVINSRSFGEDKRNVLRKSFAYMQGMLDSRLLVTAKHFPGHGDTDTDSHHNLPVISHTLKHLENIELYPYKHLIKLGLNGIMVAHLQVNALDNRTNRPSSISQPTITGFLKNKLGFQGLIFTDALNMRGIADYYKSGQLEIEAIKAGNDILLYPENAEKAIKAIEKAIRNGELSENLITQRCKKILAAKLWLGLHKYKPIEIDNLVQELNSPQTKELNHWFAAEAITCIKNTDNQLPLNNKALNNLAVVTLGNSKTNGFHSRLEDYTTPTFIHLNSTPTQTEIAKVQKQLASFDNVIVTVQNTSNSPYKKYNVNESLQFAVHKFSTLPNAVLVYFGNPYALQSLNGLENYSSIVITYHDNEYTHDYAAQMIMGGQPFKGKLPVTVLEYNSGTGVRTTKTRLGFTHPNLVKADEKVLRQADSLAMASIAEKATPGCVILAARNGNIFYHKAFGYHTYENQTPVNQSDIYDIASVTKIISTVPSIMYLCDQQKIDLEKTIGDYINVGKESNPAVAKIIDVLTHQARFKAWYPFYTTMLDAEGNLKPKFFSHKFSKEYPKQVAYNIFASKEASDTIYHILDTLPLRDKAGYLYSDIGYYYLYKIIEATTGKHFDEFVDHTFYDKIKCSRTCFNPLTKWKESEIVPTEKDLIFRKQLIHGFVHDQGAAILGGVCGHAGLFSTALDVAKFGQMYLNGGTYGGERFITQSTIDFFTKASFTDQDNRRGIGFDKPEYRINKISPTFWGIPLESFGHSGFTGTYLWMDPESGIMFIFLSNRIHPTAENKKLISHDIRTRLHKIFYESIRPINYHAENIDNENPNDIKTNLN